MLEICCACLFSNCGKIAISVFAFSICPLILAISRAISFDRFLSNATKYERSCTCLPPLLPVCGRTPVDKPCCVSGRSDIRGSDAASDVPGTPRCEGGRSGPARELGTAIDNEFLILKVRSVDTMTVSGIFRSLTIPSSELGRMGESENLENVSDD